VRALAGVDLVVHAGEVVAVTGGAGAGKTTLLLCAAGLVRPDEGRVSGWAMGRTTYVGPGRDDWVRRALAAVEQGACAVTLDLLDVPSLAAPRPVAALAGSLAARGVAVLVAARDPRALPAFATRLVTLREGRVIRDTPPLRTLAGRGSRGEGARVGPLQGGDLEV
jgi:ABC-type hemin transport system ATPase subunit